MVLDGFEAAATRRHTASAGDAEPAEQRALVPLAPTGCNEPPTRRARPPAAPFLAQLIATARGEPQTRDKRRVEPDAAAEAYAAAPAFRLGNTLSRKM